MSTSAPRHGAVRGLLGAAVFAFGAGYLIAAVDNRAAAANVIDLNIIGFDQPFAALLGLVALFLGVLAGIVFFAPRLPKRWQNAGVVVFTTLLLLVVGEAVARVKAIVWPSTQGVPTYSSALWKRRHVELNDLGFRDPEHLPIKPPGVRRLLVVGDSYTYGVGIDDIEDRFAESVARGLAMARTEQWEPISGGKPDTDTLDHIEFLKQLGELHPDVVVLAYVFNDMDYLAPITERVRTSDPQGILQRYHPNRVLFLNSYLYQEIFVRLRLLSFAGSGTTQSPYMDDELLNRHMADVRRFVDMAHSLTATVLVVPYDNTVNASPSRVEQYRHFLERAAAFDVPVCSLLGAFDGRPVESLRVNALDAHPNAEASRVAAAHTVECILAKL